MALKPCKGCGRQVDTTAAACPGCGRPKPTASPVSAVRALVGLAAFGILGVMLCGKSDKTDSPGPAASASRPAERAAPPPPPAKPIGVTAVQLYRAYDENEVSADARYKGEALLVDGVVDSIDKDFTGDIVLHLRTGNSFNAVMATMKDSQAGVAAALKKRQRVELLCRGGTRIVGSPTLDDCEVSATWK